MNFFALFFKVFLNFVFFSAVLGVALFIALTALSLKVHTDESQTAETGTIVKKVVPIPATANGKIASISVKEGQEVRKNDLLATISSSNANSSTESSQDLNNIPNSNSANDNSQTTMSNKISSPGNGVISKIAVNVGDSVSLGTQLMAFYSNDNIRVVADVTTDEYKLMQQSPQVFAYSDRLDRSIMLKPYVVMPSAQTTTTDTGQQEKKIQVLLVFVNPSDGVALLNNEDIAIRGDSQNPTSKPFAFLVQWWDRLNAQTTSWFAKVI